MSRRGIGRRPLRIAVLRDPRAEGWLSMDLAADMLVREWRATLAGHAEVSDIAASIPRIARRLVLSGRGGWNADRLLARFASYPARALGLRARHDLFHVVDHSYAQLVHVLPASRTGVYCHDLDAFESALAPEASRRPVLFRAMSRIVLEGLRRAAVVFHSTRVTGARIASAGIVPPERLVHAPYGVSEEFAPEGPDAAAEILGALGGAPFLLHVGSGILRKRLDVLFEVFARLRARRPKLRLVQQGALLSEAQREDARRLGIDDALLQPPELDRPALASLYRRAEVVLLPSSAEGFGLPIVEALACGAPVVASDLPVLREVGGDAVLYSPVADVAAWTSTVESVLACGAAPSREARLLRAREFSWARHARTVWDAYRSLDAVRAGR